MGEDVFNWNAWKKFKFSVEYGVAKLFLPFWVISPRWRLFTFEWLYSLTNFANTFWPNLLAPRLYPYQDIIVTTEASFHVRSGTHDASIVSPAFERQDWMQMQLIIKEELDLGRHVEFLDVGANIGAFTVRVAKIFLEAQLRVHAFEPVPDNADLLQANLTLNRLTGSQVCVYRMALSDHCGELSMKGAVDRGGDFYLSSDPVGGVRVEVQRGDAVLENLQNDSVLVIKMDVEGHELKALEGLSQLISRASRTWLCVEDIFERDKLYEALLKTGFKSVKKLTPYNSWWVLLR